MKEKKKDEVVAEVYGDHTYCMRCMKALWSDYCSGGIYREEPTKIITIANRNEAHRVCTICGSQINIARISIKKEEREKYENVVVGTVFGTIHGDEVVCKRCRVVGYLDYAFSDGLIEDDIESLKGHVTMADAVEKDISCYICKDELIHCYQRYLYDLASPM
jgi:hypothetical protein